jgi:DUF1680 family protein
MRERFQNCLASILLTVTIKIPPGKVDIKMKDGMVYSERVDYPYGDHTNPINTEDIIVKFRDCASYSLAVCPDAGLDAYLDSLIAKIAAAQEPDGYLYPARTLGAKPPVPGIGPQRWVNLNGSHELYNVGHLYEAAVAVAGATGLDSLMRTLTPGQAKRLAAAILTRK